MDVWVKHINLFAPTNTKFWIHPWMHGYKGTEEFRCGGIKLESLWATLSHTPLSHPSFLANLSHNRQPDNFCDTFLPPPPPPHFLLLAIVFDPYLNVEKQWLTKLSQCMIQLKTGQSTIWSFHGVEPKVYGRFSCVNRRKDIWPWLDDL